MGMFRGVPNATPKKYSKGNNLRFVPVVGYEKGKHKLVMDQHGRVFLLVNGKPEQYVGIGIATH